MIHDEYFFLAVLRMLGIQDVLLSYIISPYVLSSIIDRQTSINFCFNRPLWFNHSSLLLHSQSDANMEQILVTFSPQLYNNRLDDGIQHHKILESFILFVRWLMVNNINIHWVNVLTFKFSLGALHCWCIHLMMKNSWMYDIK